MAKLTTAEMIDAIKELSVLELNELVKACEEEFGVSAAAGVVVAAAGVPVAKHGNRSISSKSGAGDVLEALGVNISADPEVVEKCVEEVGIGFMFAPHFNPAMKYVGPVRNEMGIRTVFNTLGPLSNPSRAKAMVVGVYSPSLTEVIAGAMVNLGVERGFVVSCLLYTSPSPRD